MIKMEKNMFTVLKCSSITVLTAMLVLVSPLFGMAQEEAEENKFGDDPDKCKESVSLYREYYKQDNLKDAMMGWRWAFLNCPMATKNIVINGPKIVDHFIQLNKDNPEVRQAYIDTLKMIYDRRVELYPEDKGYALGRKGMDLYDLAEEDYTEPYNVLSESMEADGESTDAYVLMRLYMSAMRRLVAKQMEMGELYDLYDKVSTITAHQFSQFEPGTGDENKEYKKLKQAQDIIDQNFERIAKEDQYIEMMKPKVEADPKNAELLEKVSSMMAKRSWTNSDFYLETSEKLYAIQPSAVAAYNLYEGHMKKGNTEEGTRFLEESVKLETDNVAKADKLLKLAKVYGGNKNYTKARSTAQQAAGLKPDWGEPYIYIGDLYLSTSTSCGDNACSKKYGIWAAQDQFEKARAVDASISETANKKIASCRKYYPTKEDCFFHGVEDGAKVTVGGWIGVETSARLGSS